MEAAVQAHQQQLVIVRGERNAAEEAAQDRMLKRHSNKKPN